ncbi:MAG: bacterial transcriptional activator domain-containing protein, partial [Pseudomonadota bacterium]
ARRALSTDLWRVRSAFKMVGFDSGDLLVTKGQSIAFHDSANVFVDCLFLEQAWRMVRNKKPDELTPEEVTFGQSAVDIYIGDFALGFEQEWCFILRERLRSVHLSLIKLLMDNAAHRDDWSRAARLAERLLVLDPLLEHAHRTFMQAHFLMGNRAVAIRQFQTCRDILDRELGVSPSSETVQMYRGLISLPVSEASVKDAGQADFSAKSVIPPSKVGPQKPLTDQLSMALGSLDAARSLVANVDRRLRNDSK